MPASSANDVLLVADDDPAIRKLVHAILQSQHYTIVEAADGERALALARELQPRVVVLDIIMPRMDGLAVCRAIKRDRDLKRARVIMLTGRGDMPHRVRGRWVGADAYLTKPFSPLALMTEVEKVFPRI